MIHIIMKKISLLSRVLLARGAGTDGPLTADAAEPKSCADYRAAGLPCRAAQKGPGSVRESMKWLQGLAAIIIDPVRCPATAAEFSEYEYERDPRTESAGRTRRVVTPTAKSAGPAGSSPASTRRRRTPIRPRLSNCFRH